MHDNPAAETVAWRDAEPDDMYSATRIVPTSTDALIWLPSVSRGESFPPW